MVLADSGIPGGMQDWVLSMRRQISLYVVDGGVKGGRYMPSDIVGYTEIYTLGKGFVVRCTLKMLLFTERQSFTRE